MSEIRLTVPLPPSPLRSNNRCNWRHKSRTKQRYSVAVWGCAIEQIGHPSGIRPPQRWPLTPWPAATVTFTWRACKLPDQANVLSNCKALLDILCMAPKTTQTNNTTYLGIIEDDKGVEAIGKVEKVNHRHEEEVLIEIERR